MKRLLFTVAFFAASSLLADAAPADLVVFPEVLPEVMNAWENKMQPVLRLDKAPDSSTAGVQLVPPEKSTYKCSEAVMEYAVPGYGTLIIHVIDDPKVAAPSSRLAQEHVMTAVQPKIPGYEPPVTRKLKIKCATGSDPIDGYYSVGTSTHPSLILIAPDAKGTDRFAIMFSWIGVGGSDTVGQEKIVTEWLPRAAATLDLAKLQAAK